jgi:hypothetical protein
MTSIKPPGTPGMAPPSVGGSDGVAGKTGATGPAASEGGASSFAEALRSAKAHAVETKGVSETESVLAEFRAGRIDRAAALDQLADRAVARSGVAALTEKGAADLKAFLRDQLEHDPALAALLGGDK